MDNHSAIEWTGARLAAPLPCALCRQRLRVAGSTHCRECPLVLERGKR